MGAWGVGSLENDSSQDWLIEFCENGVPVAVETLDAADESRDDGYIDADVGSGIVALAELLAASLGKPDPALSDQIAAPVGQYKADLLALQGLKPRLITALGAVMSNSEMSELYDLWDEAGEFEAWAAQMDALRARLEAA
ncbi:DUF4259 domain-containing protein [Loktanella agnita]|uniref:DUF4259 domain-containing protein n=1 Tax=Loktanella agnita TaxID=287097 RepID=UPI003986E857